MTAVGSSVGGKVGTRERGSQIRHRVPHRLRLLEIFTGCLRAFGATLESLQPGATTRLALPAGMEQLGVRTQAAATREVFDRLAQSIDPAPGIDRAPPVRDAPGPGKVCRTVRTHHAARRHHLGHLLLPPVDAARLKVPESDRQIGRLQRLVSGPAGSPASRRWAHVSPLPMAASNLSIPCKLGGKPAQMKTPMGFRPIARRHALSCPAWKAACAQRI